jgi:hypothetical protein
VLDTGDERRRLDVSQTGRCEELFEMTLAAPGSPDWSRTSASYDVVVGDKRAERAAWTYRDPLDEFEAIGDAVAFYAGLMDACFVDDERVEPQSGGCYGGWITSDVADFDASLPPHAGS